MMGPLKPMPPHSHLPVHAACFAALDFESAGVRPGSTDEVVQIGVATCTGLDFSTLSTFRTYVQPEGKVCWEASRLHGIDAGTVAGAPRLFDLWPEIQQRLSGRVLVAHSAATERRHLRNFPFHGFGPWVDTLALARAVWPTAASHKLGPLVEMADLGDDLRRHAPGLAWHDALFDALASLALLRRVVDACGAWGWPARELANTRVAARLARR